MAIFNKMIRIATIASLAALWFTSAGAEPRYAPWKDLLNMKPDSAPLQAARSSRGHPNVDYSIQRIDEASGDRINFDEYTVDIAKMPTSGPSDPESLLVHIRRNLSDFFDPSVSSFHGHKDVDMTDWKNATSAPLGALMEFHIKVFGPIEEQAAVVTSLSESRKWIFSPVTIGMAFPGEHPVSGNREFGIRNAQALKAQIYTRAADRPIDNQIPSQDTVFNGADKLWRSFQARVADYVNTHGGQAVIGSRQVINDVTWKEVQASGVWDN